MKKAALHNLGCKVNSYETEAMQQLLEQNGYEIVPFSEKADVYVINTCSVTNMADRKSRQMLHRAKTMNPDSIVVAAGCYVQTAGERAELDDAIDILIGNNKKHELIAMLEEYESRRGKPQKMSQTPEEATREKSVGILDINKGADYEMLRISRTAEHTRAFIKVQDGCNQFCSYCIIPYARGRVRSRALEDVLEEAERLAKNGYQEVVLTGIHLSSYGVDTGESLLSLIRQVHEIEGITRIRLGSLEPGIVTKEFARELSSLKKVCPHFHLSLQSGCDATLRRMNRKYTCEEYRQGLHFLRKYFIHPAITTDIIVGFPRETEEEFEETRAFLKEAAFYEIHIFKYSRRQGTKAAAMENQVPEQEKARRSNILFADTAVMQQAFEDWYLGKQVEVLLEEELTIGQARYFTGHTPEYVKAAVPAAGRGSNQLCSGVVTEVLAEHILLVK